MVVRDGLLAQAKFSGLTEDWNNYRKERNKVTSSLRFDKETWKRKSLEDCEKNSAKM